MSENGHHRRTTKAPEQAYSGAFVVPAPAAQQPLKPTRVDGPGTRRQPCGGRPSRRQEHPMPDTTSAGFDRAAALTTAQHRAYEHAQAAQQHHAQALEETAYAYDRDGSDYMRADVAAARQRAQGHASRTADSVRLADMWARVARALAATADGRVAAYDLNVQLDPQSIGDEIQRQLRTARGHGG